MKALLATAILFFNFFAHAQELYIKTFGNKLQPALVFLHGGPGYNCANFEATTAQRLADAGFYVVVYDRRGEGRSIDKSAAFTFEQTFADLNAIYKFAGIKTATLLGHSFGGIVATLFAQQQPKAVTAVVLIGSPVSLQETFKTIIHSCKEIYAAKQDSANLGYLNSLQQLDTTSIMYSTYCFMYAMRNGFYTTKTPNDEAKNLYGLFKTDTLLRKYASRMNKEAPEGFWKNEKYTTLDLTDVLKSLPKNNMKVYGFYGKQDGLYSPAQIEALQALIGKDAVKYYDNCSHNVFIDQQTLFINDLISFLPK